VLRWADLRGLPAPPSGLRDRVTRAVELYPCQLLFVHRDAEGQEPELRYEEIRTSNQTGRLHVAVVPVRMQEAWLLHDEGALREAAGRPQRPTGSAPTQEVRVHRRSEVCPPPRTEGRERASRTSGETVQSSLGRPSARRPHRGLVSAPAARSLSAPREGHSLRPSDPRHRRGRMTRSGQGALLNNRASTRQRRPIHSAHTGRAARRCSGISTPASSDPSAIDREVATPRPLRRRARTPARRRPRSPTSPRAVRRSRPAPRSRAPRRAA